MSKQWEKEVAEVETAIAKSKAERREHREIKQVMLTNHVGKLKKHKNQRKSAKPTSPKNFIKRASKFTNYGAALGMTDEQYIHWKKTGELPKK